MKPPAALRFLETTAMVLAVAAGATVVILALLIVFDIVARSQFRYSLQGTDELGGYTLALIGSLGLTYTLVRRGHPRIDIGFRFFPPRLRQVLHVVALAGIAGFALFMLTHAIEEFESTLTFGTVTNTPLQTPLWVPQVFWLFGTGFFALTAIAMTAHGILLLATGNGGAVETLYGPITIEEELQEYLHDTAQDAGESGDRRS